MVSGYVREDTKHDATTYTLGGFYKLTPKIKACTVVFQFYQLSDSFRLKLPVHSVAMPALLPHLLSL